MVNKFSNEEIARLLRQISAAYTVKGVNYFRIIAYDKASEAIEKSNIDVRDLWKQKKLSELPGIGKTIADHLDQLFTTGKVDHFQKVKEDLPKGMFPLLDVPGFGPKKAFRLATEFKLDNQAQAVNLLLRSAKEGKIAPLEGFGDKSEKDIITSLEGFKKGRTKKKRMPMPYAQTQAALVVEYLKQADYVQDAIYVGSLRRMVSTIGDVDIAASTMQPGKTIERFLQYPKKQNVIETGPTGASVILDTGLQIDLRVTPPQSYGSMLQYFTGSLTHNIRLREVAIDKGLSLSEYGIKKKKSVSNKFLTGKNFNRKKGLYEFFSEKDFYNALGMAWIPPELRENNGEIEAAQKNNLPELVNTPDIKGEVHVHSDFDLNSSHDTGSSSLKELLLKAGEYNYQYLGISDHNPKYYKQSKEDIISVMKRRKDTFEQILLSNKNIRVKLFIMLEVDILTEGQLALPDKAFDFVDAVIVSIHSSFAMEKQQMTNRILKGLSHPKAKIFAHPTGRLIGKREGYEADWVKIFDFCRQNNKALEINSYPDRLDLADFMVRAAVKNGNKLIINTDSHDIEHMQQIGYGVSVARRGWAT